METFRENQEVPLPSDADPEILREFIPQISELAETAEEALLALEARPDDAEPIHACLRALHAIKGTSACMGLPYLSGLAHETESLLSKVRAREIQCTPAIVSLGLKSVDMIKALNSQVQTALDGKPVVIPENYTALLELLGKPHPAPRQPLHPAPEPTVARVEKAEKKVSEDLGPERGPGEAFLRVRLDRCNRLVDLLGELMIAYSVAEEDASPSCGASREPARRVSRVGKLVRELHAVSMSLRMVPLRGVFQKLARVVRDTALQTQKPAELVLEGEDTEMDRNMIEALQDPLVHMIRNAVDHGIEPPDVRRKLGKPPAGTVSVSAYRSGENVVIELADDGKGIDLDRVRAKGIALGLLNPAMDPSAEELCALICAPGFSTAEKVTAVSGRGVGMDVVRRAVDSLRGRIEISSVAGKGSTFTIRLPLTLAVTDGIVVRIGVERFILPTASIAHTFRPSRGDVTAVAGGGEVVRLRDEILPLYRLNRLFGIPEAVENAHEGLVAVVSEGALRCGILVDGVIGQQQVVAKPLGDGVQQVKGFSGGAILGDGRVGLILDVNAVISLAKRSPIPVPA